MRVHFFILIYFSYLLILLALGIVSNPKLDENWAYFDQVSFHLPQIRQFQGGATLLNYHATSATTPLSHIIYATFLGAFDWAFPGFKHPILIVSSIISAATLSLVTLLINIRSKDIIISVLLTLPILSSSYFLLPSMFAVTEGPTYLFYVIFLLIIQCQSKTLSYLAGVPLALTILTRQIFFPIVFAPLIACLFSRKSNVLPIQASLLALAVPCLSFGIFVYQWGGPVPENFNYHRVHRFNTDAILNSFFLIGVYSLIYLLVTDLRIMLKSISPSIHTILFSASIVTASLLVFFIREEPEQFGSLLWRIYYYQFHTPLLHAVIATICGFGIYFVVLMFYFSWQQYNTGLTFIVSMALYFLGLGFQEYAWQRYVEVIGLITLSAVIVNCLSISPRRQFLFSIVFIAYFLLTVFEKVI